MAQKLLLFWRKPARRCWWEGIELENVEGVEGGRVKVWIRRVWTLEMVSLLVLFIRERFSFGFGFRELVMWLGIDSLGGLR